MMSKGVAYILGHSDAEIERLQLQADCLEKVTRRLIDECGIEPGMRVLDFGCGVGDVAFLVAEAVGPSGTVVGVDREARAVEAARACAERAGCDRVEFLIGSDETLEHLAPFDAVIGRFVLVHQPDPIATVRRAAGTVGPGGVVAFLEPALHLVFHSEMPIDLIRFTLDSLGKFFPTLPNYDIAGRIISCFEDAGLPEPQVLWESLVTASDPLIVQWLVSTYAQLLPHMERMGLVHPEVGDPSTLCDRILAAASRTRAQFVTAPLVSAWSIRS